MSITVSWDNESKTIIRCEFDTVWTWNDVFAINREIDGMMTTVKHSVYIIVVMEDQIFPKSGTLIYTKHLFIHKHSNYAKHVVFVGGNILIKTFEQIIRKAYAQSMSGIHSDYVDSLDEARQLITPDVQAK
jgi:hypothetical protein